MNAAGDGESATVNPGASTTPTTVASSGPNNLTLVQTSATMVRASWTPPSDTGGRDVLAYDYHGPDQQCGTTGATGEWSAERSHVTLPDPLTLVIFTDTPRPMV